MKTHLQVAGTRYRHVCTGTKEGSGRGKNRGGRSCAEKREAGEAVQECGRGSAENIS